MTENPRPKSSSQPQSADQVPEMDLGAFRKLMRNAFAIASEPSDANPKLTRFIAPPYNPFVSRATSVEGHAGGTKISPHNILAVLAKSLSFREVNALIKNHNPLACHGSRTLRGT